MFFVYILQSEKDLRTYVGYTSNLERRFQQHNSGQVKSTKHRTPFKLINLEDFNSSIDAKKRELWWKSGAGRRKLKEFFDAHAILTHKQSPRSLRRGINQT